MDRTPNSHMSSPLPIAQLPRPSTTSSELCRSSSISLLDSLYEITYLPEDDKIPVTKFPIVNPYNIFLKHTNFFTTSVKQIFELKHHKRAVKEIVQSPSFDQ